MSDRDELPWGEDDEDAGEPITDEQLQDEMVAYFRTEVRRPLVRDVLRRAAQAALAPVRWKREYDGRDAIIQAWNDESPVVARRPPKGWRAGWEDTADHIVAFQPAVALALLEEMNHLLAIIQEWSVDPENCGACAAVASEPCPYHRGVADGEAHMRARMLEMLEAKEPEPLPSVDAAEDDLLQRAADMAVTFGGSMGSVLNRLQRVVAGAVEQLQFYGFRMTGGEVDERLTRTMGPEEYSDEKVREARLALVMEKTASCAGALEREGDTDDGRRVRKELEELRASRG